MNFPTFFIYLFYFIIINFLAPKSGGGGGGVSPLSPPLVRSLFMAVKRTKQHNLKKHSLSGQFQCLPHIASEASSMGFLWL